MGEGDEDLEHETSDSLEATLPLHDEIGIEDMGEGEEVFGGDTNPFITGLQPTEDCMDPVVDSLVQILLLLLMPFLLLTGVGSTTG